MRKIKIQIKMTVTTAVMNKEIQNPPPSKKSLSNPHKPNPVATMLSNKNPLPIRIPSNLNPLAKTSLSNKKLEISNSKPQINPLKGRTPTSLIFNRTQLF